MAITLNAEALRRSLDKRMDLSSLPAEHTDRGSRFGGVFVLIFSMIWGGGPTVGILHFLAEGEFDPLMLFMLIFTVVGAGLFVFGLYLITYVKTTRIDGKTVQVESKWRFGHKIWEEPLANYPGVIQRSEYHSGSKHSSGYTVYLVELHHEDKKRRLRLYESRSEAGIRGIWEDYCRQLSKPALENDGGQMRVRSVEDLDKSVKELAKEGKVQVNFDASVPPPKGLRLSVEGETLRIVLLKGRFSPLGAILLLAIPMVFVYIGFGGEDGPVFFGVVGLIFMLFGLGALAWSLVAKAVLEVRGSGIKLLWKTPWGDTPGVGMEAEKIESVSIGKPAGANTHKYAVLIAADDRTLPVGQGLPAPALEWLKNCILAVITR